MDELIYVIAGKEAAVETQIGKLMCPMPTDASKGDTVILTVRPQDINTHDSKPDVSGNIMEGKIRDIAFLGDIVDCRVFVKDTVVNVRLSHKTLLQEGETVYLEFPSDSIVVIPGA